MTIPSGRGRNGDLSITIILLKSESTLHLSRSISPSINQDSKQTVFPKSQGDPLFDYQKHPKQKELGSAMLPSSWLARWNVLHGAPSAHRFLHELADPCLFSGSQLLQREGDRPQGAFVEVRAVVEAERRVPRLELVRGLEEADDLAVLGIRGHPVPELRREGWRAGFDNRMEPLAEGAIRCLHLADLREHGAFPVRLVR